MHHAAGICWKSLRHWLALAAVALLSPIHAPSQPTAPIQASPATFDFEKDREPTVLLDGLWRFHPGDDPNGDKGWASPTFDDSAWPLILSNKSWSDQGYKNMSGSAWYRVKVLIPAGEKPLSLYIPYIFTNYQLFADGKFIGGLGDMPPNEHAASRPAATYDLPQPAVTQSSATQPRVLTLAIRVWHWPHWAMIFGGGLQGGIRIGRTPLIQEAATLRTHEVFFSLVSRIILSLLEILAALASLSLFALRPREREYLWFGIWLLLSCANRCLSVYTSFHLFSEAEHGLLAPAIQVATTLAGIAFYYRLLHGRRTWLFWLALGSVAALLLAIPAPTLEWISVAQWNVLDAILLIPTAVWIVVLLIQRTMQGLPDARLLLAPCLLQQLIGLTGAVLFIGYLTGWYRFRPVWFYRLAQWPFPITLTNIGDALFLLAMLAILIYRFTRTSQQQERLASELEAARTVQQVLVPREIPPIPGFTIQSVYKPASQVGGHFFQILPIEFGGLLAVIGDVSGKGLPAAMTVSLLVGTLRTLAHYTQEPGEILTAMNIRMLARSNGGFTTCLVLRAAPDGTLTVANAGHIAPYVNGHELHCENGLPLGLSERSTYTESTFQLHPGDQLTLITDGVVEARSKSGELFGFDRTAAISTRSAETVAQTAQDFGQEDDITALTLMRA